MSARVNVRIWAVAERDCVVAVAAGNIIAAIARRDWVTAVTAKQTGRRALVNYNVGTGAAADIRRFCFIRICDCIRAVTADNRHCFTAEVDNVGSVFEVERIAVARQADLRFTSDEVGVNVNFFIAECNALDFVFILVVVSA